ncbi:MAG: glucohydrolase [Pseudonocardiales bacterium]|nr:glucohydrolase [Pseudonocardiales bacterium]
MIDDDLRWWQKAVVYQIYPASFADTNGDGIGDLGGVISRLDYLAELGVDVIWLSPIYPTPWDDGGYDISDYQDIEPRFGTLDQFDELVREAHHRGLKVILDLVANHTSDEHPWFSESRSSRENPKRDWYFWRAEPTNWLSEFHQPAWELDETTGEYYLHLYSRKQPDLNWENPEVRAAIYEMMRWWLDRGVDGFRMDVVNKLSKRLPFTDVAGQPGELYVNARSEYVNGPRVHEFVQEMNREAIASYGARLMTVGETSGVTIEDARRFTDQARHELDMVFTFEHVRFDQGRGNLEALPFDLVTLKQIMTKWQDGLSEVGWNSLYWNNHDQPRVVSRWGDDGAYRVQSATTWATILHLHRGTPYVYQGEELGMTNYPFASIGDVLDIGSLNYWAHAIAAGEDPTAVLDGIRRMSRDNARTPMQWDGSPHAGFTTGDPWLPVNPNYLEVNAEVARADETSVWHHYRRLIALRHEDPIVTDGDFHLLLADDPTIYAFRRTLGRQSLLMIANVSGGAVDADPALLTGELILGNYPGVSGRLRPWESRVYRRR